MYIPANELKHTAKLASQVSENALRLLDLAEKSTDEASNSVLMEVARDLVQVSEELNQSVENTAIANTASGGGIVHSG